MPPDLHMYCTVLKTVILTTINVTTPSNLHAKFTPEHPLIYSTHSLICFLINVLLLETIPLNSISRKHFIQISKSKYYSWVFEGVPTRIIGIGAAKGVPRGVRYAENRKEIMHINSYFFLEILASSL